MITVTYSKILPMYPHLEMIILEISPKMRCFGGKDGKSCESGEIDHSESISASFWGEKIEKHAKLAVWTQSNPHQCRWDPI